jgi:hypothetical protein
VFDALRDWTACDADAVTSNELRHRSVTLNNGTRVTRLPVGRVSGRTWLSFVIEGEELGDWWSLQRHVRLTTVQGEATRLEGGGGGTDEEWLDHRTIDLVDGDLTITYLDESGNVLAEEIVPQFP